MCDYVSPCSFKVALFNFFPLVSCIFLQPLKPDLKYWRFHREHKQKNPQIKEARVVPLMDCWEQGVLEA